MTMRLTLNLDLNANDLEALCSLVDHPKAVAAAAAPHDPRGQARIIDVLAEIKSQITITNYEVRE
ncbi:TPA: hypothetical protein ACNIGT_005087 [Pseudomonas aeruginosa]|uniref:hypothetical protein n=1 Tax=Pseudomonas TaxID=286 RepID=UPI000F541C2C|nr:MULTISPECIES: hypothetical protein [Pseudomonas]EKV8708546.1 hypothetical protein [Pseudomonas aeruginosa]MBG5740397.1 hypothetical protein [Pseudomonas aeruginosa]MBG5887725.1 hypothetical protein [Pseudomonas aeruginosa]RQH65254.1 hypothetical protein IPC102_15435 [Pseudomonas aeruginosa]HBN8456755.1 hypothetical protein [Pseudomonas aeruginosa]